MLFLFYRSGGAIGMHDFPFTVYTAEQVSTTALVMYHPAIAFKRGFDFGIYECPGETVFDMRLNIAEIQ